MRAQFNTPAVVPVPLLPRSGLDAWQPLIEQEVPPGTLRGAIYDRASEPGGYVYAEQAHYKTAAAAARLHNVAVIMYRHEDKKGSKRNRAGLADVLRAAELRLIDVVIVDTLARLDRRGPDRLKTLERLEQLGVKVLVASKQRFDEPGVIRYVEAWQDEQYLRDQADKTIRMMPHAIAAGKHPGPDPIGYHRVYELADKVGEKPTSRLVRHPDYGPLVGDVFKNYADGASIVDIVHDLNSGPLPNPKADDGCWQCSTIRAMLRRKVYLGVVEWGRSHPGEWGKYDGYAHKEGAHEALVSPELWEQAQARLQTRKGARRVNQRGQRSYLLDSTLVCGRCGSHVYTGCNGVSKGSSEWYVCARRHRLGRHACAEPHVSVRLADEAVLTQIKRLEGKPWEPQAFDAAVRRDPHEGERRRLRSLVSADERELVNQARAFTSAADFSPEVTAAFSQVAEEIKARLRRHQAELAALPERHADTVTAKEVYDLLTQRDIPMLLANAQARPDMDVVRDIVAKTVSIARIVERGSRSGATGKATWARAEVEWTPEVQLLDGGLLALADDAVPASATRHEMAAERARRYRARQRAVHP
jgi:DNA invertase Pin-like site-specific DNA recombinase